MARLPFLTPSGGRSLRMISEHRGLNQSLAARPGEYSTMRNTSHRFYPAIAAREPRGTTQTVLTTPNGIYWKNGLFYVDGTDCYYNGEKVLTVADSKKILVGMGAYIVIFPDKKVFNTNDGTVKSIEATYTQSGTITFEELTQDSVFTKISATGIDQAFERSDGVKFSGVGDDSFLVDGEDATKVITEKGDGYIVVSAVIQNSYTGKVKFTADGSNARLTGTGIHEKFKVNDVVRIAGTADDVLNASDKKIISVGTDYIVIEMQIPAKTYTQSGSVSFSPYFSGSDKTRIYSDSLGSGWSVGDIITIAGCTNSAYNKNNIVIENAGTNFIVIDGTLAASFTQTSGLTITRTAHEETGTTVKRTSFTRSSGITIRRECQDFDYVCEHNNRLWACSNENHEIYASKLGDPTNWNCYEGISTDSYAVTVGSDGNFTGCVSHMGHVIFFKEHSIHMMYGDKPANFSLNTSDMPGVMEGCADSIEIVNETLYYVGRDGIYQFDGAFPAKISRNITQTVREAVSVQAKGLLYISCLLGGERKVLCFDPNLKLWDIENEDHFLFAHYGGGEGYFVDDSGAVRTIIGDDADRIDWMVESPDIRESLMNSYVSQLMFTLWLERGTVANFYIKCDDSPLWEHKGTIRAEEDKLYTLPIIPKRCSKYRYRIEFTGAGKLIAGGRYVEGGTELYGSVSHGHRRA